MSIWRWADWLPAIPESARFTLGEGNTPLVRSQRIGPSAGLNHLFFKLEMGNPTGSYKDRFAASAISHMRAGEKTRCIATSSGNTGSALAAYCAAARIDCEIAIVETAPAGKLQQMLAHGARLYRIRGFGLDSRITKASFEYLQKEASQPRAALQISAFRYSPLGMSGVQTISYELAEQSEVPIGHVFVPAGGGGLTLAIARGFEQLAQRQRIASSPRIECVQPVGNDTIAGPLARGGAQGQTVECTTRISGLQVPSVIDADDVIAACRRSGGTGHLVPDNEIYAIQKRLAREEGILCEPAGAVALTGALQALEKGTLERDAGVVCIITGAGFKDPAALNTLIEGCDCPTFELSGDLKTLK